jgi:hypothetical protein
MPRLASTLFFVCLSWVAMAQPLEVPAPSPKARVEQRVGLTDMSVDYSSPAVKGRKVWGTLVPYDQIWRAGANAATKLTVSRDVTIGGSLVKAGSYAILMKPGKTEWQVFINSNVEGGFQAYDAKNDAATLKVKPAALGQPRERLVYLFSDTTDGATALDLEWEKVRIRIPISVDTTAQVNANMERALGDVWRPHFQAARYLHDSGGDLEKATALIDRSIAIQPTWWNHWVRAQIMGKKGNKAEAAASATKAQSLGNGDRTYEQFFKADIAKALAGWK